MRFLLTHIALLASALPLPLQRQANSVLPIRASKACSTAEQEALKPDISIAELSFWGFPVIPTSEQIQIADSIKQKTYGTSMTDVLDESTERARNEWQNRGYYKAEVSADSALLSSSPVNQSIALRIHVEAGQQYRLGGITFRNNKVFTDSSMLRGFFSIRDADIFSREKIATGLENLRVAYGKLGYINFTEVPEPKFDEANGSVNLDINFDEGKQFRLGNINTLGLEGPARDKFLRDFSLKPGQIYNQQIWEAAWVK
jgi:outer membrane protein insertion porin family